MVAAEVPAAFETVRFTAPAACAGATTVSEPDETTETDVPAVPPKLTVEPGTKLVPESVTVLPPFVEPEFGDAEVSVGAP